MKKLFGVVIAALLISSGLGSQASAEPTESVKAPTASVVAPLRNPDAARGLIQDSKLIWMGMTMVSNAYGTQCYANNFNWQIKPTSNAVSAWPGLYVHICARPIDNIVLGGASWACMTVNMSGTHPLAWKEIGTCATPTFSAPNKPYRLINAKWLYCLPNSGGMMFNVRLKDLKIDIWGSAAGFFEWEHSNIFYLDC